MCVLCVLCVCCVCCVCVLWCVVCVVCLKLVLKQVKLNYKLEVCMLGGAGVRRGAVVTFFQDLVIPMLKWPMFFDQLAEVLVRHRCM